MFRAQWLILEIKNELCDHVRWNQIMMRPAHTEMNEQAPKFELKNGLIGHNLKFLASPQHNLCLRRFALIGRVGHLG